MSATSRRSILSLMGLATGAALVNTEAMASEEIIGGPAYGLPGLVTRGMGTQLKIAEALEGLARSIRSGDCAAMALETTSRVDSAGDAWLKHDVLISVEVLHKEGEA